MTDIESQALLVVEMLSGEGVMPFLDGNIIHFDTRIGYRRRRCTVTFYPDNHLRVGVHLGAIKRPYRMTLDRLEYAASLGDGTFSNENGGLYWFGFESGKPVASDPARVVNALLGRADAECRLTYAITAYMMGGSPEHFILRHFDQLLLPAVGEMQ